MAVRPSGTEPKVKFYLFAYDPPAAAADLAAIKAPQASRIKALAVELPKFSGILLPSLPSAVHVRRGERQGVRACIPFLYVRAMCREKVKGLRRLAIIFATFRPAVAGGSGRPSAPAESIDLSTIWHSSR